MRARLPAPQEYLFLVEQAEKPVTDVCAKCLTYCTCLPIPIKRNSPKLRIASFL